MNSVYGNLKKGGIFQNLLRRQNALETFLLLLKQIFYRSWNSPYYNSKKYSSNVVRGIFERPVSYLQHSRTIQFNFKLIFTSRWNLTAKFCVLIIFTTKYEILLICYLYREVYFTLTSFNNLCLNSQSWLSRRRIWHFSAQERYWYARTFSGEEMDKGFKQMFIIC